MNYAINSLIYFSILLRTTEKPETEAFLVCSDDTCFDPAVIEDEQVPDLKVAASARLPDENLRLIFEQMTQRINQEIKDSESDNSNNNNIRLLLEAAKVETSESVSNVENGLEDVDVDEIEAEDLNEEDKSSSSSVAASTLFKPAAARPKLVLGNKEHSGLNLIVIKVEIHDQLKRFLE